MKRQKGKPQYQYILFDLDDTLYPREAGLMTVISERIVLFMTQKMGIPLDDATLKKRDYYQKFGTSLRGLIEEYHIDPAEFLAFVHDVNPREFFGPSPPLDRMLRETPLRKVIFTNADTFHCERVLDALQVRPHFEQIIDINQLNFKSKPDPYAYQRTLALLEVAGESCIMIDDKPRNLIPAKDLGMTTILINDNGASAAIDYIAPTIFHAEKILRSLIPTERF